MSIDGAPSFIFEAPLIAISYATADLKYVGPIVEALLISLDQQNQNRIYFYAFADEAPDRSETIITTRNAQLYRDADLMVLFSSERFWKDGGAILSLPLGSECSWLDERQAANKQNLVLSIDGKVITSPLAHPVKLTHLKNLHANTIVKIILSQISPARLLTDRLSPRDVLFKSWVPGLRQETPPPHEPDLRKAIAISTIASSQTVYWNALKRAAMALESELIDASKKRIDTRSMAKISKAARYFFEMGGGPGVIPLPEGNQCPFGFRNSLLHNRAMAVGQDVQAWRTIARITTFLSPRGSFPDYFETAEVIYNIQDLFSGIDSDKTLNSIRTFLIVLQEEIGAAIENANNAVKCINSIVVNDTLEIDEVANVETFINAAMPELLKFALWT